MKGCKCTARLSVISFAIALGVLCGVCMMLFAWFSYWYGHGVVLIAQWGEIYSGYTATIKGGWVGLGWGFVEGFISGLILALVYNFCLCCCRSICGYDDTCVEKTKTTKKM